MHCCNIMTGRRKRPLVSEKRRKRVARAFVFVIAATLVLYLVSYTDLHSAVTLAESSKRNARDRTEALEGIVRHCTVHLNLDKATMVGGDDEEESTVECVNYATTGVRLSDELSVQLSPLI